MEKGAGIEKDPDGICRVPLTTVATGTSGNAADERYDICPLAIGNPRTNPSLSVLAQLYRGLNSMEGRLGSLIVEPEDLSAQTISLLQLMDSEINELRSVEFKRRRDSNE